MLVVGDQTQAILSVEYIPEKSYVFPVNGVNTKWQLQWKLGCVLELEKEGTALTYP